MLDQLFKNIENLKTNELTKDIMSSFVSDKMLTSFNIVKVLGGIVTSGGISNFITKTVGVSTNAVVEVIDNKKISEIKLSDLISTFTSSMLKPITDFLRTTFQVQKKDLSSFIQNIGKILNLNDDLIKQILTQLGLETSKIFILGKISKFLDNVNAIFTSIKAGFLHVLDALSLVKDKVSEWYNKVFKLSPGQVIESMIMTVVPPIFRSQIKEITSFFGTLLKIGFKYIDNKFKQFIYNPIKNMFLKVWRKVFKKKDEKSLLEELVPKEIKEIIEVTEELLGIAGLKLPKSIRYGVIAAAIGRKVVESKVSQSETEEIEKQVTKSTSNIMSSIVSSIKQVVSAFTISSTSMINTSSSLAKIASSTLSSDIKDIDKLQNIQQQLIEEEKKIQNELEKLYNSDKLDQKKYEFLSTKLNKTREKIEKTKQEIENTKKKTGFFSNFLKPFKDRLGKIFTVFSKSKQKVDQKKVNDEVKKTSEKIKETENESKVQATKNICGKVVDSFREIKAKIKDVLDKSKEYVNLVKESINNRISSFITATKKAFQNVKDKTKSALDSLNKKINDVAKTFSSWFSTVGSIIVSIHNSLSDIMISFGSFIGKVKESFVTGINKSRVIQAIKTKIESGKKLIRSFSNKISDGINKISFKLKEKIATIKEKIASSKFFTWSKDKISNLVDKSKECLKNAFEKMNKFFKVFGVIGSFLFTKITSFVNIFNIFKFSKYFKGIGTVALVFSTLKLASFIDKKFLGGFITEKIKDFFASIIDSIRGWFDNIIDWIKDSEVFKTIENVWQNISDFFSSLWQNISDIVSPIINSVKDAISSIWNFISPAIEWLTDKIKSIKDVISKTVSKTVEKVGETFNAATNYVSQKVTERSISNKVNQILSTRKEEDLVNVLAAITAASQITGIDKNVLFGMAYIESKFNPKAKNDKTGASGLFQFIPSTWREFAPLMPKTPPYGGGDVNNPYDNALAGALYSRKYISMPPIMYLYHFLPGFALRMKQAIEKGQTNIPASLLLEGLEKGKTPQMYIQQNSILFPKGINSTVYDVYQNAANLLQTGMQVGNQLISKTMSNPKLAENLKLNIANAVNVGLRTNVAKIKPSTSKVEVNVAQSSPVINTNVQQLSQNIQSSKTEEKTNLTSATPKPTTTGKTTAQNTEMINTRTLEDAVEKSINVINSLVMWNLLDLSVKKAV